MRDTELADVIDAFRRSISGFDQVPIEAAIQERAAGPFPAVIATLDAIHLATALVWIERYEEPLLFVTHDVQLAIAARISGLDVQTTP
jgi:hypothetical protein